MPLQTAERLALQHQRDLATIAGATTSVVASVAMGADPATISTWYFGVVDGLLARIQAGHAQARLSSTQFLQKHAAMNGVDLTPVPASLNMERARTSLRVTGPVAFQTAMRAGQDEEQAIRSMATQMAGSSQRLVMAGDRDTFEQTLNAGKGVIGWRRRLAGRSCGFCAMLASRGAVYETRKSATQAKDGLAFHDHCNCWAEPMYKHETEPPEVRLLQRQWRNVTAGKRGGGAARAWRQHWEENVSPVERERLGMAAAKAAPSPIPGPPVPTPGVVVRSALDSKKTLSGLEQAWTAEARRITGRDLDVVIPAGTSLQTAKEYAEGVLRGMERFPDSALQRVRFGQMAGDHYAEAGGIDIEFNERWATIPNRPGLQQGIARDIEGWAQGVNGWGARGGGTTLAVALHEFGHIVDINDLGKRGATLGVIARHAAREGIGPDELIARDISVYATTHPKELVAEAFMDVMLRGQAASPAAREIFDLLEAEYFRAGGRITPSFGTFPAKAAPVALSKMTVADLRALAKERGVTLPPKALKADIVRALEEGPSAPTPRVVKARAGSTIGDVELGPTQGQVALGEADIPRRPTGDFRDRPFDGPDGAVVHRGEPLPEGFESPLTAIRRGEFEVRPGLTEAESQALDRYVLSRVADPLNTALREGRTPPLGTVQVGRETVDLDQVAAELDSAIAASELAADTILYRGALMRSADLRKLQPGAITREDGFLSTTTDSQNAYAIINWRRGKDPTGGRTPVTFEILAPKGTHGAVAHVDELEVLLGRGRRLRVVDILRPTRPGDVRKITLELLPEPQAIVATAVKPNLSKLKVADLRTMAAERQIPIPAKATKAELVRLVQSTPDEIKALQQKAIRDAARERNRLIESSTGTARLLAEVDELISKGASKATILQRLDPKLVKPEQVFAGADPAIVDALRVAVESGDAAKLRTALTRAGTKAKVKPISKAGAKVKFDPATMEAVAGEIPKGAQVVVLTRGSTLTLPDGSTMQLTKAKVTAVATKPVKTAVPSREAPTAGEIMRLADYDWRVLPEDERQLRFAAVESAIRQVVDGDFNGITVRLKKEGGASFSTGFIGISGDLMKNGRKVGTFYRTVGRDRATGDLVAQHSYLHLTRGTQGSGFAEEFNQNLFEWYRRSGIKRVELTANEDVGGYAWATKGFEFEDAAAATEFLDRARPLLDAALKRTPKGLTAAQVRELDAYIRDVEAGRAPARTLDIARFGRAPGQGGKDAIWAGKWLMLKNHWNGVLDL